MGSSISTSSSKSTATTAAHYVEPDYKRETIEESIEKLKKRDAERKLAIKNVTEEDKIISHIKKLEDEKIKITKNKEDLNQGQIMMANQHLNEKYDKLLATIDKKLAEERLKINPTTKSAAKNDTPRSIFDRFFRRHGGKRKTAKKQRKTRKNKKSKRATRKH
jgi:hypothetical protein